jgi:hypothetical protein
VYKAYGLRIWCKQLVKQRRLQYKDALFIEKNGIPDGRCSRILEPESAEIELTLADAVHQLDA